MSDIGLSHVALEISDAAKSAAFYARYAGLHVVHRREDEKTGRQVLWLSDGTRPFAIVLIEVAKTPHPLKPIAHLGVGVESRAEVDRRLALARADGCTTDGPYDEDGPAGYYALIEDPDGHALEISYGQDVALAVGTLED